MIQQKYVSLIAECKEKFLPNYKVFIFGSSLRNRMFRDVDIGVLREDSNLDLTSFREALEESQLPYLTDVVDFDEVTETFREETFKEKVLWL